MAGGRHTQCEFGRAVDAIERDVMTSCERLSKFFDGSSSSPHQPIDSASCSVRRHSCPFHRYNGAAVAEQPIDVQLCDDFQEHECVRKQSPSPVRKVDSRALPFSLADLEDYIETQIEKASKSELSRRSRSLNHGGVSSSYESAHSASTSAFSRRARSRPSSCHEPTSCYQTDDTDSYVSSKHACRYPLETAYDKYSSGYNAANLDPSCSISHTHHHMHQVLTYNDPIPNDPMPKKTKSKSTGNPKGKKGKQSRSRSQNQTPFQKQSSGRNRSPSHKESSSRNGSPSQNQSPSGSPNPNVTYCYQCCHIEDKPINRKPQLPEFTPNADRSRLDADTHNKLPCPVCEHVDNLIAALPGPVCSQKRSSVKVPLKDTTDEAVSCNIYCHQQSYSEVYSDHDLCCRQGRSEYDSLPRTDETKARNPVMNSCKPCCHMEDFTSCTLLTFPQERSPMKVPPKDTTEGTLYDVHSHQHSYTEVYSEQNLYDNQGKTSSPEKHQEIFPADNQMPGKSCSHQSCYKEEICIQTKSSDQGPSYSHQDPSPSSKDMWKPYMSPTGAVQPSLYKDCCDLSPEDWQRRENFMIDHPIERLPDGSRQFRMQFDLRLFKASDVKVKTCGCQLSVTASQTEHELNKSAARHYRRVCQLPPEVDVRQLEARLGADGILTIWAAVDPKPSPAHSVAWCKNTNMSMQSVNCLSTPFPDYETGQKLCHCSIVSPKVWSQWENFMIDNPLVTTADGRRIFHVQFDLRLFLARDIEVKTCGRNLVITANQEIRYGNSSCTRSYWRLCLMPDGVDESSLSVKHSRDGILTIEALLELESAKEMNPHLDIFIHN